MSKTKYKELLLPSNRKFGIFFSVVFALISLYFFYAELNDYASAFFFISILLALVALLKDNLLLPFNIAWIKLGNIMGILINPIILSLIFFILITPISIITYLFGRDELNLRKKDDNSFWKIRDAESQKPDSFNNQF
tara:strand:+ start:1376 stop:1786 length:411 start_codon:yes stop_codon:yes gene_type:complete